MLHETLHSSCQIPHWKSNKLFLRQILRDFHLNWSNVDIGNDGNW